MMNDDCEFSWRRTLNKAEEVRGLAFPGLVQYLVPRIRDIAPKDEDANHHRVRRSTTQRSDTSAIGRDRFPQQVQLNVENEPLRDVLRAVTPLPRWAAEQREQN